MAKPDRKKAGEQSPASSFVPALPLGSMFLGFGAGRELQSRGEGRPLAALNKADAMVQSGVGKDLKEREDIYRTTNKIVADTRFAGVTYGLDQQPRFEMSDRDATLNVRSIPAGGETTLDKVLNHPVLYAAVPTAKDLKIRKGSNPNGSEFDAKTIKLAPQYFSNPALGYEQIKPEAMGHVLHEVQHHVQDIEGFDIGGSPKDFADKTADPAVRRALYERLAGEEEARLTAKSFPLSGKDRRRRMPGRELAAHKDDPTGFDHPLGRQLLASEVEAGRNGRNKIDFASVKDAANAGLNALLNRDMADGKPMRMRRVDPKNVIADAKTFQFKSGGDQAGVTDRLKGVKTWDPAASGKTIMFERADGQLVIADGHQRLGLAKRLEAEGQQVKMDAVVLRERDGWAPRDVYAYAALKNIKESSGNALDMAKVMRERPDLVNGSMPLSDAKVREAVNLSKLSKDAFDMVVGGAIKPEYAAAVGARVGEASRHADLLAEMAKSNIASGQHAAIYVDQALAAGSTTETQTGLFGDETHTRSLIAERAAVLDKAISALRSDKRIFSLLEREAGTIEGVGNRLSHEANAARAGEAGNQAALIEALAKNRGPVSDMLESAARAMAEGKKPQVAARGFVKAVGDTLKSGGINALTGNDVSGDVKHDVDPNQMGLHHAWDDKARAASADVRSAKAKGSERMAINTPKRGPKIPPELLPDANGRVRVLHGTANPFDAFDFKFRDSFYFAPMSRMDQAQGYAKQNLPSTIHPDTKVSMPRVVEADLTMKNPWIVDRRKLGDVVKARDVKEVMRRGHDGVILWDSKNPTGRETEYIAINNGQIKIIGSSEIGKAMKKERMAMDSENPPRLGTGKINPESQAKWDKILADVPIDPKEAKLRQTLNAQRLNKKGPLRMAMDKPEDFKKLHNQGFEFKYERDGRIFGTVLGVLTEARRGSPDDPFKFKSTNYENGTEKDAGGYPINPKKLNAATIEDYVAQIKAHKGIESAQGDMLPKATTKDKIAAASRAKAAKGRTGDAADHGLFSSGMKQTDLVNAAKAPTMDSVKAQMASVFGSPIKADQHSAPGGDVRLDVLNALDPKGATHDVRTQKAIQSWSRASRGEEIGATEHENARVQLDKAILKAAVAAPDRISGMTGATREKFDHIASWAATPMQKKKLSSGLHGTQNAANLAAINANKAGKAKGSNAALEKQVNRAYAMGVEPPREIMSSNARRLKGFLDSVQSDTRTNLGPAKGVKNKAVSSNPPARGKSGAVTKAAAMKRVSGVPDHVEKRIADPSSMEGRFNERVKAVGLDHATAIKGVKNILRSRGYGADIMSGKFKTMGHYVNGQQFSIPSSEISDALSIVAKAPPTTKAGRQRAEELHSRNTTTAANIAGDMVAKPKTARKGFTKAGREYQDHMMDVRLNTLAKMSAKSPVAAKADKYVAEQEARMGKPKEGFTPLGEKMFGRVPGQPAGTVRVEQHAEGIKRFGVGGALVTSSFGTYDPKTGSVKPPADPMSTVKIEPSTPELHAERERRYINRMRAVNSSKTDAELRTEFNSKLAERAAKKGGGKLGGAGLALAPIAIGAAMFMAAKQARAEGRSQGDAVKEVGKDAAVGMGGFMAAHAAGMALAAKAGIGVAKALPVVNGVMMAGNAVLEASRAAPGHRLEAAARGAWDVSAPGMIVNTAMALKQVADSVTPKASNPAVHGRASGFAEANRAYKVSQQAAAAPAGDTTASGAPARKGYANPMVQAKLQARRNTSFTGFKRADLQ